MRKYLYATAMCLALSATAFAGDNNGPKNGNATAIAGSSSSSKSTAISGAAAIAGANANTGNSSASVNNERSAPGFGLGGLADGDCIGTSGQVAVSTVLGGGGFGLSQEDVECTKRRTARLLYDLGMREEAFAVARNLREYKAVMAKPETAAAPKSIVVSAAPEKAEAGRCDPVNGVVPLECTLGWRQ